MSEIDRQLEQYVDLMEIKNRQIIPPSEAEYRASLFLTACAHCINWRATYAELKHGAEARRDVAYKLALIRAEAKNAQLAKAIAEADPEYQKEMINANQLEDKVKYFEMYYQLFTNSHIFYRQTSSQIHKESRNGL